MIEKKQLAHLIDAILSPLGFKKKGNRWYREEEFINKLVVLQKSQYGNSYYVNYGYIINAISLDGHTMHVFNVMSSFDSAENKRIVELLDLDKSIDDDDRINELKFYFSNILVRDLEQIKTEDDLRNELKSRSHINDILLIVKKRLNLI